MLAPPVLYNTTQIVYKTGFGTVSLECSAYGNPDPSISIVHRDKVISPASSAITENITMSGQVIHVVKNVAVVQVNSLDAYATKYACLMNNSQGNLTTVIAIQPLCMNSYGLACVTEMFLTGFVIDLPNITHIETLPLPVLIGSKFSLTCTATGNPLPNIVWILPNGTTVNGTITNHQLYRTSQLVINSAEYENSGKYECIAMTGPLYEDHDRTTVVVAGLYYFKMYMLFSSSLIFTDSYTDTPNYPVNITVTNVTSTSAVVKFRLGFHGRSPVLSFTVKLILANSSESRTVSINGNDTVGILNELHPYTVYFVSILSTNAVGSGEYSPRLKFRTDITGKHDCQSLVF